jgi:hypothetical protein
MNAAPGPGQPLCARSGASPIQGTQRCSTYFYSVCPLPLSATRSLVIHRKETWGTSSMPVPVQPGQAQNLQLHWSGEKRGKSRSSELAPAIGTHAHGWQMHEILSDANGVAPSDSAEWRSLKFCILLLVFGLQRLSRVVIIRWPKPRSSVPAISFKRIVLDDACSRRRGQIIDTFNHVLPFQ